MCLTRAPEGPPLVAVRADQLSLHLLPQSLNYYTRKISRRVLRDVAIPRQASFKVPYRFDTSMYVGTKDCKAKLTRDFSGCRCASLGVGLARDRKEYLEKKDRTYIQVQLKTCYLSR